MKRLMTIFSLCGAVLVPSFQARADQTFTVDTAANWQGFMNVFELPENGGAYVFGSGWGTDDLVAVFNAEETVLTLAPNSVNDPNPFWYQPMGGPGSVGNKIMDANFYVEHSDMFAGEVITFQGTVLSNSLTSSHVARAFIRDFAPDYSAFVESSVVLTPGPFSIELFTDPSPGRHVQYGFNFNGVNVWITDVEPFGTVTVEAIPSPGSPGDFDDDGDVDGRDFLFWQRGNTTPPLDPGLLVEWQDNYGTSSPPPALSMVPEPSSVLLLCLAAFSMSSRRLGYLS